MNRPTDSSHIVKESPSCMCTVRGSRSGFKTWPGSQYLLILFLLISPSAEAGAARVSSMSRCKYSVRDVAFVNIHGKSWQLELIKPPDIAENEFANWNRVLRKKLALANIGFVWCEGDSSHAKRLRSSGASTAMPQMYLTNSRGAVLPVAARSESFEAIIDRLIHSPVRKKLLDQLTDSLCVFLLIQGPDDDKNNEANLAVLEAVEQVNKQMWMMEKASDNGPSVVVMDYNDQVEALTLKSIGLDPYAIADFPAVAIMFGQARRLGDVCTGNEIGRERLVSLAAICGSDCECELDRNWLYGDQMLHDWDAEYERKAEDGLDFDPKSAFVMAEVAQVLQKNSGQIVGGNRIEIGSGLVIHDLDDEGVEPHAESQDGSSGQETEFPEKVNDDERVSQEAKPSHDRVIDDSGLGLPWFLFGGLTLAAILIVVVRYHRRQL